MKNLLRLSALLLLCSFMLTSCSKDDDDGNNNNNTNTNNNNNNNNTNNNNNNNTGTCSDGLQNGSETDIDCGGPCPACTGIPNLTLNSIEQIYFELDGAPKRYINGVGGAELVVGSSKSLNVDTSFLQRSSCSIGDETEFMEVNIGSLWFQGSLPGNAEFETMFAPGTRTYTTEANFGVAIALSMDGGNNLLFSDSGTGDQTGSTFEIIDITSFQGFQDWVVKARISFSCKLYDINGNSFEVTNGIMVVLFANA